MRKEKPAIYSYTDMGDFVHCNWCSKTMLVPTGTDKCPACYMKGMLAWADEELQEMTHSQLAALDGFNIVVKKEPQLSEYLSDEVLVNEFEITTNGEYKNYKYGKRKRVAGLLWS